MKRLLCRWAEYYLALCEGDIENGLPGWVRRHLQGCSHCQRQLQAYGRAHQAMRQYARLLPDSPAAGWRPLPVKEQAERRVFPLRLIVAFSTAAVAVVAGFVAWRHNSVQEQPARPQLVQRIPAPPVPSLQPDTKPAAPPAEEKGTKREPPKRVAPPSQKTPAQPPRQAPSAPVRHPRERIVVAVHPEPTAQPAEEVETVHQPPPEPPVPVQPVVVEAHPVASAHVPQGYVMEAAVPTTTGAVE